MNGITHKIAGACTGLVLASMVNKTGLSHYGIMVAGSVIGSLYPDIDEPSSTMGQKAKPFAWLAKIFLGHRGIIHTPINCLLLTGIMYCLHNTYAPGWIKSIDYNQLPWMLYIAISFFAGYMSHLILDLLTPQGIMVLFPFTSYRFHIIGFKGFFRDAVFSALLISSTIIYFLAKYNLIEVFIKT